VCPHPNTQNPTPVVEKDPAAGGQNLSPASTAALLECKKRPF